MTSPMLFSFFILSPNVSECTCNVSFIFWDINQQTTRNEIGEKWISTYVICILQKLNYAAGRQNYIMHCINAWYLYILIFIALMA